MSYERLSSALQVTVGSKQSVRLIEQGNASEVFIARDTDQSILTRVMTLCNKMGVRVTLVDSKQSLGKACGIEVGAAVVAIKHN